MFPSSLGVLRRTKLTKGFSRREFDFLFLGFQSVINLLSVHWWPGDRDSTKDWTQWDEEAFNSGVVGPFLEYAGETGTLLY